jgi:hypothetical protein
VCKCRDNFFGLDCSLRHCPNSTRGYECNNHGTCEHRSGFCKCTGDHYGPACEYKKCPIKNGRACNGQGTCYASTWEGALGSMSQSNITDYQGKKHNDFSRSVYRPKTGQKDVSITTDGVCSCRWPHYGPDCAQKLCPNSTVENWGTGLECDGHGLCDRNRGVCQCQEGYFGKDCNTHLCPFSNNNAKNVKRECNGEGSCDRTSGRCKCHNQRYFGASCEKLRCPSFPGDSNGLEALHTASYGALNWFENGHNLWPNECSGVLQGDCDTQKGKCVCKAGFYGPDCAQKGAGTTGATQRRLGIHLDVMRPLRQDKTLRDRVQWNYGGTGTSVPTP